MKENKDIVDFLNERKQLEQKLLELRNKESLLPAEFVIKEEIELRLTIVNKHIENYS